jgi:effector-binding domain-containing protein
MRQELTRCEAALDFIEKTLSSPLVVELSAFELTTLPPRRAVTVSGDIEAMNAIAGVRRLVAAAGREVHRRGLTVTGPAGALFSLDLEASPIAVTAFTPVAPAEDLANLPEGPVATVVYRGDPRGVAAAYQGLLDWIEERGLVAVDPFVEEYLARDKGLVVRLSVGVAA